MAAEKVDKFKLELDRYLEVMGMLAGLLGNLSIDGSLCVCVWSVVCGGRASVVKVCCVVDVVCFLPRTIFTHATFPGKKKKKKN